MYEQCAALEERHLQQDSQVLGPMKTKQVVVLGTLDFGFSGGQDVEEELDEGVKAAVSVFDSCFERHFRGGLWTASVCRSLMYVSMPWRGHEWLVL